MRAFLSRHERVRMGRALLIGASGLLKTAATCERGHRAMRKPAEDLLSAVRKLQRYGEKASLTVRGGRLFCGDASLVPVAGEIGAFLSLQRLMKRLDVGTIVFSTEAGTEDLDEAAHLMLEGERLKSGDRFAALLQLQGIAGLELERMAGKVRQRSDEERNRKERAKAAYGRALETAGEVMDDVRRGTPPCLLRSRRAVQGLIETLLTGEEALLGLTTVRCRERYSQIHPVNVTVLSLAIGRRVGLKKASLVELGMAALFHDIGKSAIPGELLDKPSEFTEEEWGALKRHPVLGVRELLRLKGIDALTVRIMTSAFEHHMNCDLSGYPEVRYGRGMSLFGRIIGIADSYDALSSTRVYSREAKPPDKALRYMLSRSGVLYDAVLMKLFVNCVGLYPVGTLCVLDTGETAVVVQGNPDPEGWDKPVVRIISDTEANPREGETVDLAASGEGRSLARTLDAERHGIDVAQYFL